MDRSLKEYLGARNLLAHFAITILFLFTLSLGIFCLYTFWSLHLSWFFLVLVMIPLPLVLFLGHIESCKIYHENLSEDRGQEVWGLEYVKVKSVIHRITKELEINKKIRLFYDRRSHRVSVMTFFREAHIIIGRKLFNLDESMIEGVMAHELIHIYNEDLLKMHKIIMLGYILAIYIVAIGITLVSVNIVNALVITGILGISGTFLTMLPSRIIEETADCGTAYLGYGSGLLFYLGQYQRNPVAYGFFSTHDSTPRRIQNIMRVTDEINGNL